MGAPGVMYQVSIFDPPEFFHFGFVLLLEDSLEDIQVGLRCLTVELIQQFRWQGRKLRS